MAEKFSVMKQKFEDYLSLSSVPLCSNDETIDRELDEQLKQHIADEIPILLNQD